MMNPTPSPMNMSSHSQIQPPAWLNDDEISIPLNIDTSASSIGDSSHPNSGANLSMPSLGNISSRDSKKVILFWGMKVISLCLCILMTVTAVMGLGSIHQIEDTGKIYVGVYMLFFSSLLFVFEALGFRKEGQLEWLDHMYKRNFGFLYSTIGKSLYLIFIAVLSFGLGEPLVQSYITGALWLLFGGGIIAMNLQYPELFA